MIGAELLVVDPLLALIGRQHDRRAEERLARHDVIAAGQILAQPPQITREKMTCVPAEPMSMPTLVSVTWSAIQSGFSSVELVVERYSNRGRDRRRHRGRGRGPSQACDP